MPLDCKESPPRKLTAASYFKLGLNGGCMIIVLLGILYICWPKLINFRNHFNNNWVVNMVLFMALPYIIIMSIQGFNSFRIFYYAGLLKYGIATSGKVENVFICPENPLEVALEVAMGTGLGFRLPQDRIIYYSFTDASGQLYKSKVLIKGFNIASEMTIPVIDAEITILYDFRNPKKNVPYRFAWLAVKGGKNWVWENRKEGSFGALLSGKNKLRRNVLLTMFCLLGAFGIFLLISVIIVGVKFFLLNQR